MSGSETPSEALDSLLDDESSVAPAGLLFTRRPATFDNVLLVSAALGGLVFGGIALAAANQWLYPQFWLFVASLGVFHLSEFYVTARYNPTKLTMASFLLTNGVGYAGAQLIAVLESIIVEKFWPQMHSSKILWVGLIMTVGGQALRTAAMIQASTSFSHLLAIQKKSDHKLVTTGLYAWVRHPSYAGYLTWAVGTQIMLVNPISTLAFAIILQQFFAYRIQREERYLKDFFPDYNQYKAQTWSGVLFVR